MRSFSSSRIVSAPFKTPAIKGETPVVKMELLAEADQVELDIEKLTVDETSAESLDSTRVGIVYCNNLYMVDNVWHLRRSPSYPEHDPKGACGYKPYRVTYKKGDKAYDVGKCKDGRRIYRLFRP